MDNQQNQSGSPMPGDDVRTNNAGNSTGSPGFTSADNAGAGSGAGSRKTGTASGQARGAAAQGAASGGASSQSGSQGNEQKRAGGEGQQGGNDMLNSAVESGKKWIEDSGVLNSVNQLPQSVKDWGTRAASRVGDLTTTQKIVGGALLAVGLGYLATRKGRSERTDSESRYGRQSSGSGNSGSYGRRSNYGYQAPDASNSRRTSVGSGRSDSGSAYGNSGSSYGTSGSGNSGSGSYGSGSSYGKGSSDSNQSAGSGFGSSSSGGDFGSRTSESSYRSKNDDFRSIE